MDRAVLGERVAVRRQLHLGSNVRILSRGLGAVIGVHRGILHVRPGLLHRFTSRARSRDLRCAMALMFSGISIPRLGPV